MSFLQVDHVTKYFAQTHQGEGQVCILGMPRSRLTKGSSQPAVENSGCGKSTLLNMITGLETPSEGGIVSNSSARQADRAWMELVVFQNFALHALDDRIREHCSGRAFTIPSSRSRRTSDSACGRIHRLGRASKAGSKSGE